jgi:hypothetical protein
MVSKVYNHYIRINNKNDVIYGFSNAFENPKTNDICIANNTTKHFKLGSITNPSLFGSSGIALYKWEDNMVKLKSGEDLITDELIAYKTEKVTEIYNICEEKIINTFYSDCEEEGVYSPYSLELVDQMNITGMLALISNNVQFDIYWKKKDETVGRIFTKETFIKLSEDARKHVLLKKIVYQTNKAYIIAASNKAEVDQIVNNINWNQIPS